MLDQFLAIVSQYQQGALLLVGLSLLAFLVIFALLIPDTISVPLAMTKNAPKWVLPLCLLAIVAIILMVVLNIHIVWPIVAPIYWIILAVLVVLVIVALIVLGRSRSKSVKP